MTVDSPGLFGLDFSCAPSQRKPLTLAHGALHGHVVRLAGVSELDTLEKWANHLGEAGNFVMGCDFPFGLPRSFVDALRDHGPQDLRLCLQTPSPAHPECDRLISALRHYCVDRAGFQALIDGWGTTWHPERAPGSKLPHRPTDLAMPGISSTSPLQTRYVPVGKMYFEGFWRLVQANVSIPAMRAGRDHAIALEAYPGFLAHELIGRRSYKNESTDHADRLVARLTILDALEAGHSRLGLRLKMTPAQRDRLAADHKGDQLDAVMCMMQAAWALVQHQQGHPLWGLPTCIDPVEGWILTA